MRRLLGLTALSMLLSSAYAADETDIAPFLRGDVRLGYNGFFQRAGLLEEGIRQGERHIFEHQIALDAEFGIWKWLAFNIGIPGTVQYQIRYPEATEMLYDPVDGSGSYINGDPLESPPVITGSGIPGVWFGLAASPMRVSYEKNFPVNSRLDFRIRTPAPTLYGQKRGVSPGGVGLHAGVAFSVPRRSSEPYFTADVFHEFKAVTDVIVEGDEEGSGTIFARDLELKPGTIVRAKLGSELIVSKNPESDTRTAFDLSFGLNYYSWSDRASGFYLPDVLLTSRSIAVSRGDYVAGSFQLLVDQHFNQFVGLRMGFSAEYGNPRRIENVYNVTTSAGTFTTRWLVEVVGHIRLKDD